MRYTIPAALAFVAALSSAPAQAQVEVTWSDGVLGSAITYDVSGPIGSIFALVPSFTPGPTPLAVFDPADPRSLDIGVELFDYIQYGFLATGTGSISLPLPAEPAFSGFDLRAQAVTFDLSPSATTLVDELSNTAVFTLGLAGDTLDTRSDVLTPRQGHSATLLNDGRVLIVGGDVPDVGGVLTATDSIELYDPQTQSFTSAGTLTQARSTHTATLLTDGRVLLAGGYSIAGASIGVATAEIFDPTTNTTTAVASPSTGRTLHTATLLNDGRVLVVGGSTKFDLSDLFGSLASVKKTTELYNPATDTWVAGPSLPAPLFAHQSTRLGDGRVLLSSGVEIASLFGIPIPGISSACHRFDPASDSFIATASMPSGRAYHGQIALPDGNAMAVGGATGDFATLTFSVHGNVYIYNNGANTWSTAGGLATPRAYPNLINTDDGITVLSGLKTVDVTTGSGTPATEIESAPYSASAWSLAGAQTLPREVARAVRTGKRILIVGVGDNGLPAVDLTAEVFIP